jgi:hypothetical protein
MTSRFAGIRSPTARVIVPVATIVVAEWRTTTPLAVTVAVVASGADPETIVMLLSVGWG